MITALERWARQTADAALPLENIPSGPWRGAMESRPADLVPREYAVGEGASNFLYLPRTGTWKRRGGQEIQFDEFGDQVGLLPGATESHSFITWFDNRTATRQAYVQKVTLEGAAEWTPSGVLVSASTLNSSVGSNSAVLGLIDGGCVVLYTQNVTGAVGLRAQRFDATGAKLWGSTGVLVLISGYAVDSLRVISDGGSGYFFAWSSVSYPVIRRCTESGTFPWASVECGTTIGTEANLEILPDGSGGAYVAWLYFTAGAANLYGQRITSAGAKLWGTAGVNIGFSHTTGDSPYPYRVPVCVESGALVALLPNSSAKTGIIATQRNPANGASTWTTANLYPSMTLVEDESLIIVPSIGGDMFLIWEDRTAPNNFAQVMLIDSLGASQWGPVTFNTLPTNSTKTMRAIGDGSGNLLVLVLSEDATALSAIKVTSAGAVEWGPVTVATVTNIDDPFYSVVSDGAGGMLVFFSEDTTADVIRAVRVRASGVIEWTANGLALTSGITGARYSSNGSFIGGSQSGSPRWGAKARQLEEFISPAVTDSIPTACALVTKETINSGLDDGRFGQLWWRDRVTDENRTISSEYSAALYPAPGAVSNYRVSGLWYESGDGGVTRGVTELARRFFLSGSRRFLKVGNWWYFPNLHGTPARWNGGVAVASSAIAPALLLPSGDSSPNEWEGTGGGGTATFEDINDATADDGDTTFIYTAGGLGVKSSRFTLDGSISSALTSWTVNVAMRATGAVTNGTVDLEIVRADGQAYTASMVASTLTTSHVVYPFTVWTIGASGQTANSIKIVLNSTSTPQFRVSRISVAQAAQAAVAGSVNRLIPSGPLPPTHAGTLEAGNLVTGEEAVASVHPDSDSVDGTWVNELGNATNLYASIDEDVADDSDYIQSTDVSMAVCKIGLGNFAFIPDPDSTVTMRFKASHLDSGVAGLTVKLYQGATQKAATAVVLNPGAGVVFSYTLSPAEITAITDWNDLFLQFGSAGSSAKPRVRWAKLDYAPPGAALEGSWKGSDRFLYSIAYRFEDGSVWAPCTPRLPGPDLPNGFNMFTVDANNPTAQRDFIRWTHLPIGIHGTTRIALRSLKVDSTEEGSELKLNPYDLRVVWELTDNSATEYIDYQADDFGLAEDSSGAFIRYDHLMPPRARYIAGGDMRIVHAYGGRNPCAIEIAPVGRVADYDLNVADDAAAAYAANGSYMRVRYSSSAGAFLDLAQSDGATVSDLLSINLATYDTLQKLVDRINATSCATDGQQWRAQLCPGANPAAPAATCLTPHVRALSAGTVTASSSALITRATGGLSVVAVGTYVTGTGIPADTYITRIDSDTQLLMSASATASNADTIEFETRTGDTVSASEFTYQRVIANSLPGFLYFNASYLNSDPIDKSSVWMTVGTPGSMKSAANSFSGKNANRFKPPNDAGYSTGGGAVDQGFVLPFSGRPLALKNTRDSSSGIDEDYKLVELGSGNGCVAWNTVVQGPRFVTFLTSQGMCAADLDRVWLITEDAFQHGRAALGSLAYEIQQSEASAGMDDDNSYAIAKVMRSAIWLNYRGLDATHPTRQLNLDFSAGRQSSGLEALLRAEPLIDPSSGRVVAPAGSLLGWSTPLVRQFTAMCEGRRDDGAHLYGWNDLNAGSSGDGRIDEFEIGDTDNGTEIAAEVRFPWEKIGKRKLSAQEVIVEHAAPVGSTVYLDFHRSYEDDVSILTLTPSALVVGREVKLLPQAARAVTAAFFIGYRQTAGEAAELRAYTPRVKSVPSYT